MGRGEDNKPARRLAPRLAATEPAMTALPALDTVETAVEGGRYLSTCEAAVLGLPATSVVIPASTETLQCNMYMCLPGALPLWFWGKLGLMRFVMRSPLKVAGGLS